MTGIPIAVNDLAAVAAAIPLAALGGGAFLKGVLGVAEWLRVPKLLVATTLAAFATSSPEFTVSLMAALSGKPEIGLGDALGSNVVNIALILGLALMFGPIRGENGSLRRDFILSLAIPLLTLVLAADGNLSRFEGGLLLMIFLGWLMTSVRQALAARVLTPPTIEPPQAMKALAFSIGGLLALIGAGRFFVSGASGIAVALGVEAYVIGATVVAIGTSLPELVTTILARIRGHDDVGVGTLLGSNLFNGLCIVGTAATIHPIQASFAEIAVSIIFGTVSVMLMMPRHGVISRTRGFWLLAAYVFFILATYALAR